MAATTTTTQPQQPKGKGFLASITSGVNMFVNEVEKGITKASEEVNKAWSEATYQRFRKSFKDVQADERLLGEYWAQCVTGGKSSSCVCYVSTNHFSFIIDLPTGKAHVMIPLRDVINIQPAVALRATGSAPSIQPVTDPRARPDAIQVYTRDMKLHQFFSFLQFDKAQLALLHAWQALQAPQTYAAQGYIPSPYTGQPGAIQLDKSQQQQPGLYPAANVQPASSFSQHPQVISQYPQVVAQHPQVATTQPTTTFQPAGNMVAVYPTSQVLSSQFQPASAASDPYQQQQQLQHQQQQQQLLQQQQQQQQQLLQQQQQQ